eukprot:scaffold2224_cov261-Pinguiococcus_pyrenoidosus.AAC.35
MSSCLSRLSAISGKAANFLHSIEACTIRECSLKPVAERLLLLLLHRRVVSGGRKSRLGVHLLGLRVARLLGVRVVCATARDVVFRGLSIAIAITAAIPRRAVCAIPASSAVLRVRVRVLADGVRVLAALRPKLLSTPGLAGLNVHDCAALEFRQEPALAHGRLDGVQLLIVQFRIREGEALHLLLLIHGHQEVDPREDDQNGNHEPADLPRRQAVELLEVQAPGNDHPEDPAHLQGRDDEEPSEHLEGGVHAHKPEDAPRDRSKDEHPAERELELVVAADGLVDDVRGRFRENCALRPDDRAGVAVRQRVHVLVVRRRNRAALLGVLVILHINEVQQRGQQKHEHEEDDIPHRVQPLQIAQRVALLLVVSKHHGQRRPEHEEHSGDDSPSRHGLLQQEATHDDITHELDGPQRRQ